MIPSRRLSLVHFWLAAPTLLVFATTATNIGYSPDLWTHIAQGRLVAEQGGPPAVDSVTYTIQGQPVVNQNWLGQLFLYATATSNDLALAQFVGALVYAAAFLLLKWVCLERAGQGRAAAGAMFLAALLVFPNLTVRTQTFAVLNFAVLAATLWLWPRGRAWPLAIVALNQIVWVNVHGTFVLGVILPGIFFVGRAIDAALAAENRPRWRAAFSDDLTRWMFAACVVALGATLVNPWGYALLAYVDQNVGRSAARGITEWAAPSLTRLDGVLFVATAVLVVGLAIFGRRRLSALEWLLVIAFFVLGARAGRMIVWWGLAMAPVLAAQFGALARSKLDRLPHAPPDANDEPATDEQGAAKEEPESPAFNYLVAAMFVGLALWSTPWTRATNPFVRIRESIRSYPLEPREGLDALVARGASGRVFTTMEWGAYVTWRLPKSLVNLDGRVDQFPDSIWNECRDVAQARDGWQEVLTRDQIEWIVWPSEKTIPARYSGPILGALLASPNWQEIHRDDVSVVFEKVDESEPVETASPTK